MNQNLTEFSLKGLLLLWSGLTMILIATAVFIFASAIEAESFIVLLNIINIVLFAIFVIFRKPSERIITQYLIESRNVSIQTKFRYETEIGFIAIALLIMTGGYIISLALYHIKFYSFLIHEDGIVEYASAILWFIAALVMGFYSINLLRKKNNGYQLIFSLGLMAFFIVCCGEEISWGQRLLNLETPELLKSINVQDELTLHNIGSISVFANIFFILSVGFFLLVPILSRHYKQIRDLLNALYFPIPSKFATYVFMGSLIIWICVGLRFGTLGFHPFSFYPENYYTQMDDEIFELFAAYSFFCFSLLNYFKEVAIIE